MGTLDRIIRLVIVLIIPLLYIMNIITGTLWIILLIIAVVFVLTSIIGFCPLYTLFGINTLSNKEKTT